MANWFVGYPRDGDGMSVKTFIYKADRKTKIKEVFWGDWLSVEVEHADGWLELTWGPTGDDPQKAFFPVAHAAQTRPLEIVFLDVGQGDGAVLITPERGDGEAIVVIDAGKHDGMHRFLKSRFQSYKSRPKFHAAILTHPDEDHYGGFLDIFADHDFGFDVVYQNGLVERPTGSEFAKVGGVVNGFIEDLATDRASIVTWFADPAPFGQRKFPPVIHAALNNPRIDDFRMLSRAHGTVENGRTYMPGFAPSDGRAYAVEVLGPVVEPDAAGKPRLRKIGKFSETKNGHSVLLRLHFDRFKVFFGGDLNLKAEKFLLQHYAGLGAFPTPGTTAYAQMIASARAWFDADVMKVCHHGASDVTDAMLEAVKPAAFVISSGDQEGHVHPRPDLLGRLGKAGEGPSPVLLSTELQRSTRETQDRETLDELIAQIEGLTKKPTKTQRESMVRKVKELGRSNVEVYGAIYLKTDGETLVTAFKKESNSPLDRWFHFEYRLNDFGDLIPVS